jgi:hypothetical protein
MTKFISSLCFQFAFGTFIALPFQYASALEGVISKCSHSPRDAIYDLKATILKDEKTGLYEYRYRLENAKSSSVDIETFQVYFDGEISEVMSPKDWVSRSKASGPLQKTGSHVLWMTFLADESFPDTGSTVPARARIKPGQFREFGFKSPNQPGAQTYGIDVFREPPGVILPKDAPATLDPESVEPDCPDSYGKASEILPRGIVLAPSKTPSLPMKAPAALPISEKHRIPFPVLIYSDDRIDTDQIDSSSFKLGPNQVAPDKVIDIGKRMKNGKIPDRDADSAYSKYKSVFGSFSTKKPFLLLFDGSKLGLICGRDRAVFLSASLKDGKSVQGGDDVKLVGCEKKKKK